MPSERMLLRPALFWVVVVSVCKGHCQASRSHLQRLGPALGLARCVLVKERIQRFRVFLGHWLIFFPIVVEMRVCLRWKVGAHLVIMKGTRGGHDAVGREVAKPWNTSSNSDVLSGGPMQSRPCSPESHASAAPWLCHLKLVSLDEGFDFAEPVFFSELCTRAVVCTS